MAVDVEAILAVFRVYAPEFASTSDATVNAMSAVEGLLISPTAFGASASLAVAYRVAHKLTLQAQDASVAASARGPGTVSSITTGRLSVSRSATRTATDRNTDAYWAQTGHGLAYLELRDSQPEVGVWWAG